MFCLCTLEQGVGRAEQDGVLQEKALDAENGSGVAVELAEYMGMQTDCD